MARLLPRWFALACLALLGGAGAASALDLSQRTVSASKQFTVYSSDAALRGRVASFAEELKGEWLGMLGQTDRWKYPVILTMERAPAGQGEIPPVALSLIQYEAGFKVQIDVRIGVDPADVNLQKHLLRALFLEYAYRARPDAVQGGTPFVEAPWWLIEGTVQLLRSKQAGAETELFKRILDLNRVPPIDVFLAQKPSSDEGSSFEAMDQAGALCLVQLLIEMPSGRDDLGNYLRHLPDGSPDPLRALQRDFPALLVEEGGPQKWWTLNLARLSSADRYKGLSPEETDSELAALLQFEVPGPKGAAPKSFGIADFDAYLKLPASRPVLAANQAGLAELSLRSSALYRGVILEYQEIFSQLVRSKSHGLKDRLVRVAAWRESMLRRTADIADYLNWFQATQMDANQKTFRGYIKAANDLATPVRRNDPITRYLDEIAQEF